MSGSQTILVNHLNPVNLVNNTLSYFLSQENLSLGKPATIGPPEAGHILLSHRAKKHDEIKIQGPDGKRFLCEIIATSKLSLTIKPFQILEPSPEPVTAVTLFQSVVSEKALDFIFQKGTELALSAIVLFNSANTATKLTAEVFKKKRERWNKILIESAKQCERAKWPSLDFAADVDQVIKKVGASDKVFLADISGTPIKDLILDQSFKSFKSCSIIIGPEGGFTQSEITSFKSLPNLQTLSLGPILLRAETAALASLAIIQTLI